MRLDENKIMAEINKPAKSETIEIPEIAKTPEIAYDDFMKINLRVGLVLECEKAEKSDKLLKLQVDLGDEKRQIVSGIAQFYNPGDLIGKKIIVVSNLKPAKIRGIESKGMLLASGEENERSSFIDGVKVVFAPDDAVIGSRVR
jgi:methionyl-tRNA synthetase